MAKWVWIVLISLVVASILAGYIGVRIWKSFGNRIIGMQMQVVHEPPNDYVDLLKAADTSGLRCIETAVPPDRNPISRYLYDSDYNILVTKLNFSDTVSFDVLDGLMVIWIGQA